MPNLKLAWNFGKGMLNRNQMEQAEKWVRNHPNRGFSALTIRKKNKGGEVVYPASGGKRMTRKACMSRKRKTMRRRR